MKTSFLFLSLIIFSISFVLFDYQESFAENYHIGIKHDKTCQALISAGDVWTCPTLEEIQKLFPSVQLTEQYSSLVQSETNPINIITNNKKIESFSKLCLVDNYCDFFTGDYFYWYNPSEFLSQSMDIITITPNMKIKNPVHLKYNDVTIITQDNKRQISFEINQLFISENCKDSMFAPGNDWQFELGHLIYYMKNNCTDSNLLKHVFNLSHIEETSVSYFDPLTSPNYQHRLWLEQSMELCKIKC